VAISAPKRVTQRPKKRRKARPKGKRAIASPGRPEGAPRAIGERPNAGRHPTRAAVPRKVQALHPQVEAWIADALTRMGAPELVGKIPWCWNKPMTRVMGRAWGSRKMDFSPDLFARATEEQRKETVYHECAHIVDNHQGTYVQGKAHGESFKRVMRRAGYPGARCHHVKVVRRKDRNKRKSNLKGPTGYEF